MKRNSADTAPVYGAVSTAEQVEGTADAAAVYGRVSTAEQVDGTSLPDQLDRGRSYVTARGWRLVGEYVDEGVSGAKASRPALDRLMADVRAGRIKVVVVAKLDRFGRSLRHLAEVLGELDDLGVRFLSVAESFDSTTASGRLQRNILSSFAEYERDQIRDRTTSGVLAVAREGYWPGGPAPFGWQLAKDGRRTKIEPNPDEVETIRLAAHMICVESLSLNQTANHLNDLGRPTRKGYRWNRSKLRWTMSTSPLGGRWEYAPVSGTRRRPGGALVVLDLPELLEPELRRLLARHLEETSTGERPEFYEYLLSGRLTALCGDLYTGAGNQKQGPGYKCRNHDKARYHGTADCACRRLPAQVVETVVWEKVVELLVDEERLEEMSARWDATAQAESHVEAESLDSVVDRISTLESNMKRTVAEYMRAGVPAEAVRAAVTEVVAEIDRLKIYRDRLAAMAAMRSAEGTRTTQIKKLAQQARVTLAAASRETKRQLVDLLDMTVTLTAVETCPLCLGAGKVSGKARGKRCYICWGARFVPILKITGDLPEAILAAGSVDAVAGGVAWPFTIEARVAV
jgi:DNA invertase Pin-like site-specific DNA recombinase